MLIKPIFAGILEKALNQFLQMDQDIAFLLQPLAGKVVAIHIQPLAETLFLCPNNDNIQILEQYSGEPDTTLTGSISSLAMMGLSETPLQSFFSGAVAIEGDIETGEQFQALFKQLDIDPEETLSHFTGDIIAHKTANLVRSNLNWKKQALENFKLNLTEFLQEETRDLPSKPEVDLYLDQVDDIRSDLDRLQARIEQLNTSVKAS